MKIVRVLMFSLCFVGCACGQSKKIELYRTALKDTNVSLTQARDENVELHKSIKAEHAKVVALQKKLKKRG